jgi:hypothetical protein
VELVVVVDRMLEVLEAQARLDITYRLQQYQ